MAQWIGCGIEGKGFMLHDGNSKATVVRLSVKLRLMMRLILDVECLVRLKANSEG